jgi:uncharacterized damage-inducible protein DinB
LEHQRKQLLQSLSIKPTSALTTPPEPTKWSVLQVLTHLYISEKMSLQYIKKKSLGIDQVGDAGVWESIKMSALKISQRIPVRYKAPKTVVQNTPDAMPFDVLLAHWDMLRLELKSTLENLPSTYIHKLVYKHPVAGRLSLPQAMEFFMEHLEHHKTQIDRILKGYKA